MFKRSFIGYSKASMNQVKALIDQQASAQKELIDNSLNTALEEKNQLLEELRNITARLEETRINTVLAEKFKKNIATVIGEVQGNLEEVNARKARDTEEFCQRIDEQIDLLDQQIGMIKERIYGLIQGLTGVRESVDFQDSEVEKLKFRLKDMINTFSAQVEDGEALELAMEILKLKEIEPVPQGDVITEEMAAEVISTLPAAPEAPPEKNEIMEQPAEPAHKNDPDEDRARQFFDNMKKSLESSASAYTRLKEEIKDSPEDEENKLRVQRFLQSMREYWQSSVEKKTVPSEPSRSSQEDEIDKSGAERFLDNMRNYWRSSIPAKNELGEQKTVWCEDELNRLRAQQFLQNMRDYWAS